MYLPVIDLDVCGPFPALPTYTWLLGPIPLVLLFCNRSEIGPPIIESVVVYVVGIEAVRCAIDEPMHELNRPVAVGADYIPSCIPSS